MAANHGEIVRELVAAQNADVGYENARSQVVDKTGNLESDLSRLIRNHVKAVIIPLHAGLVLRGRTELAEPGGLQGIVIGVDRTSRRKSRQRLHVWRLLQIVSIPVGYGEFIVRIEAVIQASRRQVFPRVVGKDSSLGLKLVHQERIERWIHKTGDGGRIRVHR